MSSRRLRLLAGLVVAGLGVTLVFSPLAVASLLGRPHATTSQMINLRATFGGSILGIGLFVAWLDAIRPWRRFTLGLLAWSMTGIGIARATGFLLDGSPNALQWLWMIAEIVLAAGGFLALRLSAAARSPEARGS